MKKYQKIAVTGKIGSGKSAVSALLRSAGIPVSDSDKIVRGIYQSDRVFRQFLVENIVTEAANDLSGLKKQVSLAVARRPDLLLKLENYLYPILQKARVVFTEITRLEGGKAAFFEIPLLFEKGLQDEFDKIICVVADFEVRKARVLNRPNFTEEKFMQMNDLQANEETQRNLSHFLIENNGSHEDLREKVNTLLQLGI